MRSTTEYFNDFYNCTTAYTTYIFEC